MYRRAVAPLLLASMVAFGLAPLSCSSGSTGLPPSVSNPALGDGSIIIPPVVVDAGDASAQDSSTEDAPTDAPSVDLECKNGKQDTNETDIDCGGPKCGKCPLDKKCVGNGDCGSNFCDPPTKRCTAASCSDGIKNGDESDADCGGTNCVKCAVGRRCLDATDCSSAVCNTIDSACACPARMVAIPKSTGGAYCIDETETTNGDYDKFVRANVSVATQTASGCSATTNPTFVPASNWPPTQPLSASYGLPVRHVDWCDAAAYCKWAGKALCGGPSGGTVAPADYRKSDKDAWYNACSAQFTPPVSDPNADRYPYGPNFNVGGDCATGGSIRLVSLYEDTGAYSSIPIDTLLPPTYFRTCQGGAVGLFGMSGNVAEWEDSCDGTTATSKCRVRGGSINSGANSKCGEDRTESRVGEFADVGFRCCKY